MMKFFAVFFIFVVLLLSSRIPVHANPPPQVVVIINQVRGTECCDTGIPEALLLQRMTMKEYRLQGTFALRFDALKNTEIISEMKKAKEEGNEIAIFLEITPNLAAEAGVTYKGPFD